MQQTFNKCNAEDPEAQPPTDNPRPIALLQQLITSLTIKNYIVIRFGRSTYFYKCNAEDPEAQPPTANPRPNAPIQHLAHTTQNQMCVYKLYWSKQRAPCDATAHKSPPREGGWGGENPKP